MYYYHLNLHHTPHTLTSPKAKLAVHMRERQRQLRLEDGLAGVRGEVEAARAGVRGRQAEAEATVGGTPPRPLRHALDADGRVQPCEAGLCVCVGGGGGGVVSCVGWNIK